ncbi:MAG: carboxypeptidase-like regulatory domain-containing protein [Crocinitomicaceae bacterium]
MKSIVLFSLLFIALIIGGCQNSPASTIKPSKVDTSGSIEITRYKIDQLGSNSCSIKGQLIDENGEPLIGSVVKLLDTDLGSASDIDGFFEINNISAGTYTLQVNWIGMTPCTVQVELNEGDRLTLDAIVTFHSDVQLEKPIIYLYPSETTEVDIKLIYDGELTTTYPKYPEEGWKVQAHPDGTIIDQTGREYYSLYWEGEPRHPLGIREGFVVPKEETTAFLEEKLEFLGLSPREANEFIIYWLPALEKNDFNLISFAGEDYLAQAQLNVSPKPDTEIRICMVFEGLDGAIDFPLQDLMPLQKTREGFTLVEWGGQQLPKGYAREI